MTRNMAACPWTVSAICWGNAGRGAVPLFREAVLPLDPALEAALLTEGPRPEFKLCPICGGPVPLMGGWPTAPSPVPGSPCGGKSGSICEKNGGDVWKIRPGKRPYYKALRGRFRGRPYVSMACPVLPKCFPHLKPSLLDILPRSGPIPERRYNGQKSRLFHSESCYAGKWPGLCPGASSHSPIPLCNMGLLR